MKRKQRTERETTPPLSPEETTPPPIKRRSEKAPDIEPLMKRLGEALKGAGKDKKHKEES